GIPSPGMTPVRFYNDTQPENPSAGSFLPRLCFEGTQLLAVPWIFYNSADCQASKAGEYICSPQRKLWVQVQAKPQARVSGRHIFFQRQTYSGTLDLLTLKFRIPIARQTMTEGPTHISYAAPLGLKRL